MKEKKEEGAYCSECNIWIPKHAPEQLNLIGGVYHLGCSPKHFQLAFNLKEGLTVN